MGTLDAVLDETGHCRRTADDLRTHRFEPLLVLRAADRGDGLWRVLDAARDAARFGIDFGKTRQPQSRPGRSRRITVMSESVALIDCISILALSSSTLGAGTLFGVKARDVRVRVWSTR